MQQTNHSRYGEIKKTYGETLMIIKEIKEEKGNLSPPMYNEKD
ncbi:MAG: hypothetical protein Q8Q31_03790 [Nanoarchaeota archaeon]|nr:hypothetical protein [Nanoarchaeota archaeon]